MNSSLRVPSSNFIDRFLEQQKSLDFTYGEIGASLSDAPEGYDNDHNSIFLGNGEAVWRKAKAALTNWQHFPQPWTRIHPGDASISKGTNVAVLFRVLGVWWTNSARIVYTIDEENKFGFAYGTLPGHIETGEEVFYVERERTGNVYYHIRAFSKPRFWLARLGYPFARMYQRKFVRQSKITMLKIVKSS